MSNRSKTLYTGVTNNLLRRVWQHRQGVGSEFCKHYKLDRLVYFERFQYVDNAITREKQIKGWLRSKKIALVVSQNPTWSDLVLNGTSSYPGRRVHRSDGFRRQLGAASCIGPSLRSG